MELEGRRSSDNNWYHCQISVCSKGKQKVLKVQFSEEGEEYILTPNEAQSRLRPASKCLEKGECRKLQVGDIVLVPSNRMEVGKLGLFEARIRDIRRHQHSSAEKCNCKLEVLRVGSMNEESSSILASQVRLVDLSSSIHVNPVYCDWIGSSTTQGTHRLDMSDAESDMHAHLDEQINKITMMTDSYNETSSSPTQFLADAMTKTPRTRRTRRSQSSSFLEQGRRQKQETSNYSSRLPLDKQPRLSPLAARAALAATVLTKPIQQVKLPSSPESKVTRSRSSKYKSNLRPVRVSRNPPRKCRQDLKAKERTNRGKGKETSVDFTIDLPIFKS